MDLVSFVALFLSIVAPLDGRAVMQTSIDAQVASLNLLDSRDFFVCDSKVPGMNGHYVRESLDVVQSDLNTPVFSREDDGNEDDLDIEKVTDFRLFRHNGFWMFADVEPWPPVTHFRCDPTQTQMLGKEIAEVCGLGQLTPPRIGYSSADLSLARSSLILRRHACNEVHTSSNFSSRAQEL